MEKPATPSARISARQGRSGAGVGDMIGTTSFCLARRAWAPAVGAGALTKKDRRAQHAAQGGAAA